MPAATEPPDDAIPCQAPLRYRYLYQPPGIYHAGFDGRNKNDGQTEDLFALHDLATRYPHGIRTRNPCFRPARIKSRVHPALHPPSDCRRIPARNAKYAESRCPMKNILGQMARNTDLLPEDMAAAILAGDPPPVENIVVALIIGCMDAHAVIVGDPESSWNEKRFARMALAVAFLSAME